MRHSNEAGGRRPGRRAAAITAAVIALAAVPAVPALADSSGSSTATNPDIYALSAEAVGVDTVVTDPSLPLKTTVDVGVFGSSASLNSLGQSTADAGAPYSPFVFSLPGTVDGLAPTQVPYIPEPAGYVTSDYPTTVDNTQAQGPYSISATSQPQRSEGTVRIGMSQAATSDSTVQASAQTVANPDGSVDVTASAGIDLANVGGLVDIGNIGSTESMVEQGSAPPTVTGSTNLGTVTLLGQPSGLVGSALDIFGAGVPIPLKTSLIPLLDQVLAPVGVSLSYVPSTYTYTDGSTSQNAPDPSKTIQSVQSAGLQMEVKENVKSQGLVTFTYTIGQVFVSAVNTAPTAFPSSSSGASGPAASGSSGPGSLPAGGSSSGVGSTAGGAVPAGPAASSGSVPVDTAGLGTGSAGPLSPSLGASTSAAPAVTGSGSGSAAAGGGLSSGASTSAPAVHLERVQLPGLSGSSFYLSLVLAALVLLGSSQVVRLVGIRLRSSR